MIFTFLGKNSFNLQVTAEVVGAYNKETLQKDRGMNHGSFISTLKHSNIQIP